MKKTKRLLCGVTAALMTLCLLGCGGGNAQPSEMTFPLTLSDGLTINSVFTSDVMNPDTDYTMVDSLASIELTNTTDRYVDRTEVTVRLSDGTQLRFFVQDLPAGKKVLAFETENKTLPADVTCRSITSQTTFLETDPMQGISVACTDLEAVVTNLTDQTLTELSVNFHCALDDVYYGGRSYSHTVAGLAPGESVSVTVDECFLGTAEAVRVIYK